MSSVTKVLRHAFCAAISTLLILGLAIGPRAKAMRTLIPDASSRSNAPGTIIASIKFDPKIDGFGFRNYGRNHDGEGDLDASDLVDIFGAENVCIEGNGPGDCVLYETAEQWIEQRLQSMRAGHCEGLAVDSLRFWLKKDFRGMRRPADFQSDAAKTFDLQLDENLANYIAYYFSLQSLREVSDFRGKTLNMKPSQILNMLIESFKNGKEYYTMSIAKRINGEYKDGHAITPFGVEDMGEGEYRILIYDNNYPGQTRYVEIDKNDESWRYHTAANPDETESDYVGDVSTKTLGLKRMSDRERPIYKCPFCEQNGSTAHASPAGAEHLTFSLNGEGNILITNGTGKRLGFDTPRNRTLDEIPGAQALWFEGGLGLDVPPTYRVPYQKGAKPFRIDVSGKSLETEADADMEIDGPGFVVGFDNIYLDPGENLSMTVSPDGRQLSFTASADGETPEVFITTESGPKDPSYEFNISGIHLEAGKTVTVTLDLKNEKLFFHDDDSDRDKYDVHVERTNADGTSDIYDNEDLEIGKGDNYELDFGKWNGKGPMCFIEDDEGNGFADDQCVEEPNEAKPQEPKKKGASLNAFPDLLVRSTVKFWFYPKY